MPNRNIAIIDNEEYLDERARDRGVMVINPYNNNGFVARNIRKVFARIGRGSDFLFNKEICNIDKPVIIIFDACISKDFLKWIVRNHRNKRIIFYYWNPVNKSIDRKNIPGEIECWSYSEKDCAEYDMCFNPQFYFYDTNVAHEISYDVYFCGADKGRLKELLKIERKFEEYGIKTKMRIMPTRWFQKMLNKRYEHMIPYSQIVEETLASRAILDYNLDPFCGYTRRIMEGVFLNKKIITNNLNIKESNIYHKNNVFILGVDHMDELKSFLKRPFIDNPEIKKLYDFEEWLNRFG